MRSIIRCIKREWVDLISLIQVMKNDQGDHSILADD